MRYVHIQNPGPNNQLIILNGPVPQYSQSQILVQVHYTALNRADIMQRWGKYPPPQGETEILGLELSGDVVAVGSDVSKFKVGDKVYGLVGGGAYAEFCPVEASLATLIPEDWNYQLAAALPESLATVHATLFELGTLKSGQTLLIHGANSGISSLAIQMAKQYGAFTISTAGTEVKIKKALELGANQIINYQKQVFDELIPSNSVDLIVDFIGGAYFNKHLHLLKPRGKLIQISCLTGSTVECNLSLLMRKRIEIKGFVLRSQSIKEKSKLWKNAHKKWFNLLTNKKIKPIIDNEFTLDTIEEAHQYMQLGIHFGKILVRVN